jgi:biopolymer transport protein ExbD
MKNIFYFLFLLLISCSPKKERIEDKLFDCSITASKKDNKDLLKRLKNYESELIKNKILKDNSAKSYRNIIVKIANEKDYSFDVPESISENILKVGDSAYYIGIDCQKKILSDSLKYDFNKFLKFQESIKKSMYENDLSPQIIAKNYLSVLTEDDFELNYYKSRIILVLSLQNSGIFKKIGDKEFKEKKYNKKTAFIIKLNGKNEIFIEDKNRTIKELKKLLYQYFLKNKSKSEIVLLTSRKTIYSKYLEANESINSVLNNIRNTTSQKKHQKLFSDLDDKKRKEIEKTFPLNYFDEIPVN